MVQHLQELLRAMWLLDGLRRQPEVLGEVLGWQPLQVRDLVAQLGPGSVQSPGQWWDPRKAALDQHDLERWELLEDALADQADDLRLKRGGHTGVIFQVHGWPAGAGNWIAALAAEVDPDG